MNREQRQRTKESFDKWLGRIRVYNPDLSLILTCALRETSLMEAIALMDALTTFDLSEKTYDKRERVMICNARNWARQILQKYGSNT